jgi:Sigma-70 region 2
LFKTAFRITKNASDAEDIVQEALLKAYQKIHTFHFCFKPLDLVDSDRYQLWPYGTSAKEKSAMVVAR